MSVLPTDYYLRNFTTLVDFVEQLYGDLLTPDEFDWSGRFRAAPLLAQRLYVRCIGRKGSVFRHSKLAYDDVPCLSRAAGALLEAELGSAAVPATLPELLPHFTRPELGRLLGREVTATGTRAELNAALVARDDARHLAVLQAADAWLRPLGFQHFTLYRLCFFGNLYQDTSEFVRQELGTLRYESYVIDSSTRVFNSRAQLLAHLSWFESEAILEIIDPQDAGSLLALAGALPDGIENDWTLQRRLDRTRNQVARQLERLGHQQSALALYGQSVHPPARERLLRLQLASGDRLAARKLCDAMLATPFNEAEWQVAERLGWQLERLDGKQAKRRPVFRPQSSTLALKRNHERVEHVACEFFARSGDCFWVENSLLCSVLGLFIWDIIFMSQPGAFHHPFQRAPSDFRFQRFVTARRSVIDERLLELDEPLRFATRVNDIWSKKQGLVNPLVNWQRLSEPLLRQALQRIPAAHWKAVFNRMLADLADNTSGLPDLVRFPAGGGYEFIEIKGPGDALQQNQRRWLQYFHEQRIPSRVVQVRWISETTEP